MGNEAVYLVTGLHSEQGSRGYKEPEAIGHQRSCSQRCPEESQANYKHAAMHRLYCAVPGFREHGFDLDQSL